MRSLYPVFALHWDFPNNIGKIPNKESSFIISMIKSYYFLDLISNCLKNSKFRNSGVVLTQHSLITPQKYELQL